MDLQNIVSMLGAVALFLFGMTTMTDGLEKLSSGRLEIILEKMTNNVVKGVLLGALVTGLIQSSAATTVMCVGFVNAGIMKLSQTVGIIMGANIGTTVTAQLLRLSDISSDNFIMSLLDTSMLGPILAGLGIIFYMFIKGGQKGNIGQIALGLGVLFIGMETMKDAVAPLKDLPAFQELFVKFSNPIIGIIVGAAVTALIQSSSASMGILQAVSSTGVVTFSTAAPLIFGQNIGTCITAMLSAVGASKNAKRTAMIHLCFNLTGTLFFLVVLYTGHAIFEFPFWNTTLNSGLIANLHSGFNICCTILLLPFNRLLVKIVERLVPGDTTKQDVNMLDERFLSSPSLALEKSWQTVVHMGNLAQANYSRACSLLDKYDDKLEEQFREDEAALDKLEVMLNNYLVKLTDRALTAEESLRVSELLHTLSDFERIGDYSDNIRECAIAMHQRNQYFSSSAKTELYAMTGAVNEILDVTVRAYQSRMRSLALQVEPLEEVVDLMESTLRERHVERLKNNGCTVEIGLQFLEMVINLERISDHCSNVAVQIIRSTAPIRESNLADSHGFLHELHHSTDNTEYNQAYAAYKAKYMDTL